MNKLKNKSIITIAVCAVLVFLFTVYWSSIAGILGAFFASITPLICGGVIAYIINIPLGLFEKIWKQNPKKSKPNPLKKPLCLALSFITVGLIIFILFSMILPELNDCITLLINKTPPFLAELYNKIKAVLDLSPELSSSLEPIFSKINWENTVNSAIDIITTGMGSALNTVISVVMGVFSVIVTMFVAIVFAVYLLSGKEKLSIQLKNIITTYTRPKFYDTLFKILKTLDYSFKRFIVGQCTEAVILGTLCLIGMLILRLPYATMIAALVGFTALIPVAGAYIGAIVGAFMIFTVSPMKALIFIVFLIILQQFEGNVIYPKVVGKSIGLPGIWVLAAITVGGGVAGILGMLVSVPIASAVYILIKEDIDKKQQVVNTTV